jgi:hypothetical protein
MFLQELVQASGADTIVDVFPNAFHIKEFANIVFQISGVLLPP